MDKKEAMDRLSKYNLTKFQKEVLIATLSIKKGETKTYKDIAIQIGRKHAYRAVGSALRANPLAPQIPCHRVIKSDGSLGGYDGVMNSRRKIRLLKSEGVILNKR